MRLVIQGYAIPWDKTAHVDGIEESCAPRAIAADTPRNVTILAGDHVDQGRRIYARTKDKSLRFFHDDYGLGFSAYLDNDNDAHYSLARSIARGDLCQCSVNFIDMRRRQDGRIIWGAIDHVAIVANPAYADTGCWLASQPVRDRPAHVRAMSMTFMNSVITSSQRRDVSGGSPRGVLAPSLPSGANNAPALRSRAPASLVNLMASAEFNLAAANSAKACRDLQIISSNPKGAFHAPPFSQ